MAYSKAQGHSAMFCAKMAEPIEIPFGLLAWMGPKNHVLHGVQIPSWEGAILRGKRQPIVKYRESLR